MSFIQADDALGNGRYSAHLPSDRVADRVCFALHPVNRCYTLHLPTFSSFTAPMSKFSVNCQVYFVCSTYAICSLGDLGTCTTDQQQIYDP